MKVRYKFGFQNLKWEHVQRTMAVVEFVAVILGIVLAPRQIEDIRNAQFDKSSQMSEKYWDRLHMGTNGQIQNLLSAKMKIFPKYNNDQVDEFLNDLDGLGFYLRRKLIDEDTACAFFSDISDSASASEELSAYISRVRQQDASYFGDVTTLYESLAQCE